jgi:hypothetical protein
MVRETAGRNRAKPGNTRKAAGKRGKDAFATVETYLPAGSVQRTVAGIAAAAGAALIAAAVVGVGPAALAGAAGYLVYRETGRE